ncbi:MAG TPA: glycosyltransferase family 4 protein [Candidatus Bathyarchaeia archaeon]|nr:glycosyltransferase family 4 protein [Candidatus Bathyarchaeia archaeon]
MKLAYLLSEYPTLPHTYLLREIRRLRSLGWDIQTISVRRPQPHSTPLSEAELLEFQATWYVLGDGLSRHATAHATILLTHPAGYLRGLATALRLGSFHPRKTALALAYFAEAISVGHYLKKVGIEYVHSVYSSTVALILARAFYIHLSMTLHGSGEFVDPEGFAIRDKVEAAERVCAISYFGRSQIMLWSDPADWSKLRVTPLGVDVNRWATAECRGEPHPFELISVGRLVSGKGLSLLLDAVKDLVDMGKDVRLTLVGDGPDRPALEAQAASLGVSQHVVFAGWMDQGALHKLYRRSDVAVMSSFAEGVPVVLMEAMATGIPCVAPRITGIPELIRDGVDGLLFTASNVAEMATAITRLMDEPDLRRRMAVSARARITDKYNLEKNVDALADIFSEWTGQSLRNRQRDRLDS